MAPSQEIKKLKKMHKQKLAAEANAARAAAFKNGGGVKRKTNDDDADADAAHAALEAAVAAGAAEADDASKKNAKKAKKARTAASAAASRAGGDAEDSPPPGAERAAALTPEEVAAYREAHAIKVAEGTPDPIVRFEDAPFPKKLVAALLKQGYAAPSPIQAQAWPCAVQGRDVVAVAKTGSGKTCGFLLPALAKIVKQGPSAAPDMEMVDGRFRPAAVVPAAIVLAPTRELAIQIGDECQKFCPAAGAKVVTLYGGASKGDQLRALRSGADVVVATPGRLNDFLAPPPGFSAPVSARNAHYVVRTECGNLISRVTRRRESPRTYFWTRSPSRE